MVFKTEDCVKAESCPGLSLRQKGSMMELQTLQEALKVEIQVHQSDHLVRMSATNQNVRILNNLVENHNTNSLVKPKYCNAMDSKLVAQMKQDPQNADLKKQLHELQAKITTLSEKQKKVVEQLRKDLLVKQEPDLQPQTQTQPQPQTLTPPQPQHPVPPDGKASALPTLHTPPSLPSPENLSTPQNTMTITPVIATKTLPLVLKAAATATMSTSAVTPQPSVVAMVTTVVGNNAAPKTGGVLLHPDLQSAPINLQTSSKLTNQGIEAVRIVSKNTVVVHTATAQPIKVPQFVPPPRLTPRPAFLPQVRIKPAMPCPTVPIAPAPPPPMLAAPQLLQRPVMLTAKLAATSLPSAVGPIHQVRIVNGQPCASITKTLSSSSATAQLTGIVITSPASATTPVALQQHTHQTLQISSLRPDTKTVKAKGGTEPKTSASVPHSAPPTVRGSAPPLSMLITKREVNPQKLAFMVSLGLVTFDHLEEIQSRRQERKRRTTANPVYSGAVYEPERKKTAVTYLNSPLQHQGTRKRGRPPKINNSVPELGLLLHTPTSPTTSSSHSSASPAPHDRPERGGSHFLVHHPHHHHHTLPLPSPSSGDGDIHEDFCTVCRRSGQLLMCDTCARVYHLDCLAPALKTIPKGMWICPKCQDQILKKEDAIQWPGTLAIVHSYIAYKAAKEEEKQKLAKWSSDLKQEREQLEQRVKQLNNSITRCMETKNTTLARQRDMQGSLEKIKGLVCLIQGMDLRPAPPVAPTPPSQTAGMTNGGTDCASVDNTEDTSSPEDTNKNTTNNSNNTNNSVDDLNNNTEGVGEAKEEQEEEQEEEKENKEKKEKEVESLNSSSSLSKAPSSPQTLALAPVDVTEGAK